MRAAMAVAAARFVTLQLSHKATRIRFGQLVRLSPVPVVKSRSALAGAAAALRNLRGAPIWEGRKTAFTSGVGTELA